MLLSLAIGLIFGMHLYKTREHFKTMTFIVGFSAISGILYALTYPNSFQYEVMQSAGIGAKSSLYAFSIKGLASFIQILFITYLIFFIGKIFKVGKNNG